MEHSGKDNGPAKSHELSLDQDPSHLEVNEEPEEDLVEVVVQERAAPERAADLY
jgi:hypothetical protein